MAQADVVVKTETVNVLSESSVQSPIPHQPSIPPTTTAQQDLTTAGQRTVNLIWETIQGKIALYIILGTMVIDGVAVILSMVVNRDMTAAQGLSLGFLNSLATGVTSFYFSRTNHAAIGGVGQKPEQEYTGR